MLPFRVIVATHPRPFTLRLGGLVPLQFTFLIFLLTDHCPLITAHYRFKSFNCNTYGPPRKCCKQKTYCMANSFRCNTYKKVGGVHPSRQKHISLRRASESVPYLVTSLLHYLARRSWRGRIEGQRAKTEVVRPPRGVNSPRTTHHSGRTAATMSRRILLMAFS